jgi:hypothetical protein
VILVITLAWALVAVLILTGTLINAREIDRRVVYINSQLTPINQSTGYIALADKTNVIAGKILAAVPTLAPGLQKTSADVKDIDSTVKQILSTAKQINTKVVAIGTTVSTIHNTVTGIGSTVGGIFNVVVHSITPKLATTGRDVTSIATSVNGINSHVSSILATANAIKTGAEGINGRVDKIQAVVDAGGGNQIGPNLAAVNGLVGKSPTDGQTINGHANGIDCSGLINLGGATKACGKG